MVQLYEELDRLEETESQNSPTDEMPEEAITDSNKDD